MYHPHSGWLEEGSSKEPGREYRARTQQSGTRTRTQLGGKVSHHQYPWPLVSVACNGSSRVRVRARTISLRSYHTLPVLRQSRRFSRDNNYISRCVLSPPRPRNRQIHHFPYGAQMVTMRSFPSYSTMREPCPNPSTICWRSLQQAKT